MASEDSSSVVDGSPDGSGQDAAATSCNALAQSPCMNTTGCEWCAGAGCRALGTCPVNCATLTQAPACNANSTCEWCGSACVAARACTIDCKTLTTNSTCGSTPRCEWYPCTGWGTTPVGCQLRGLNHSSLCRGPCEGWVTAQTCGAALGCTWYTNKCRSTTAVAAQIAAEPAPACHQRADSATCNAAAACRGVTCSNYVASVTRDACWVQRTGGAEVYTQACSEYVCENLATKASCEAQAGRCVWGADGWCRHS